ncbi:TetR/AcrR family transcriptional regulator C-terminal domain-containing protein [Paenibacillus sp. UNC451MF]|uniref:TetR/AcrR family transcriptional regulator C-terminal domain-containing protein n=1 Tax=Paenibacillus sp. UNC451MF TaxID=1449063 RepID=UPI0004920C7F|nr:TetR/AcrR family transcriptional regulator C-terminal domain-containing protein [Paenibacillus sp. UNC451MF]
MARRRTNPSQTDILTGNIEDIHTPLDRDRIVSTVLTMLQAEGLEQISMRKIADSLGVKAASLYYHVKDKDQLLHLLAEQISSEVEFPDAELDWREQLRQWSFNFRRTLHLYRDSVQIMGATIAASPHRLSHIEYLFRVLAKSGFKESQIPWLASMLKNYIFGFTDEENRLAARAKQELVDMDQLGKNQVERFKALPSEHYPHLSRLAVYTTAADWDTEFTFGVNVLLDGFEAQRPKS